MFLIFFTLANRAKTAGAPILPLEYLREPERLQMKQSGLLRLPRQLPRREAQPRMREGLC